MLSRAPMMALGGTELSQSGRAVAIGGVRDIVKDLSSILS
jgi:hypothetical protein